MGKTVQSGMFAAMRSDWPITKAAPPRYSGRPFQGPISVAQVVDAAKAAENNETLSLDKAVRVAPLGALYPIGQAVKRYQGLIEQATTGGIRDLKQAKSPQASKAQDFGLLLGRGEMGFFDQPKDAVIDVTHDVDRPLFVLLPNRVLDDGKHTGYSASLYVWDPVSSEWYLVNHYGQDLNCAENDPLPNLQTFDDSKELIKAAVEAEYLNENVLPDDLLLNQE